MLPFLPHAPASAPFTEARRPTASPCSRMALRPVHRASSAPGAGCVPAPTNCPRGIRHTAAISTGAALSGSEGPKTLAALARGMCRHSTRLFPGSEEPACTTVAAGPASAVVSRRHCYRPPRPDRHPPTAAAATERPQWSSILPGDNQKHLATLPALNLSLRRRYRRRRVSLWHLSAPPHPVHRVRSVVPPYVFYWKSPAKSRSRRRQSEFTTRPSGAKRPACGGYHQCGEALAPA